jgi:YggT family protein
MDEFILRLVEILTTLLIAAIFFRAILSWVSPDPYNPLVRVLNEITEPFLAPLRRVMPRIGMIDITPMIAIFILIAIQRAVAAGLSG